MTRPPAIADILAEIMTTGILNIRALGWSGRVDRCAVEADHIHNLPRLLTEYSPGLIAYYWNAERPSFRSQVTPEEAKSWDLLRDRLGREIASPDRSEASVPAHSRGETD